MAVQGVLDNAGDAVCEDGSICAKLHCEDGQACLEIVDTGEGISEEVHSQVFEPFFTTRQGAGKLGMGLTIAQRLVQLNGGTITMSAQEGEGTTVTICLPLASDGESG